MGLNWSQFEAGILLPVLDGPFGWERQVGRSSDAEVAHRLVGETIWHESDYLQALGQYGTIKFGNEPVFGPGLGVCSMEKPTWDWLCREYIAKSKTLQDFFARWTIQGPHNYDELAGNLYFAVAACRLRYWVAAGALPTGLFNIEGRARYWFTWYNGSGVESRRAKYIKDAKLIAWG